jgi:hypothetical protein
VEAVGKRIPNMKRNILELIKDHPWQWASCAAIFGYILSRLHASKKRIYIDGSTRGMTSNPGYGRLGKLWMEAWKISKPLIATYIAEVIADQGVRAAAAASQPLEAPNPPSPLQSQNGASLSIEPLGAPGRK